MPLFWKKKQQPTDTDANGRNNDAADDALHFDTGLGPDVIERLLELLSRESAERVVFRRREGKIMDKVKGWVFRKHPYRLTIDEAKTLIHDIAEKHRERHERLLKKKRRKDAGLEFTKTLWANAVAYPTELTTDDVLEAGEAARHRLEEIPKLDDVETTEERLAKMIFEALKQMKVEEATLFARRYADMQHEFLEQQAAAIENASDNDTDLFAGHGLDENGMERVNSLQGFGRKPLKTLIDEAGDAVNTDIEAAAKVVKQWIGNPRNGDEKENNG